MELEESTCLILDYTTKLWTEVHDTVQETGIKTLAKKKKWKKAKWEESRWRRNRTERSLSLLQIHRKNNRTVKKVYKTTSDP